MRSVAVRHARHRGGTGTDQSLGGEDFAWILGRVPGALARLGVRSPEVADGGDLHQGGFDIDEAAISVGVRLFCALAMSSAARLGHKRVSTPAQRRRSKPRNPSLV